MIAAALPNDSEFKEDLRFLIFEEISSTVLCSPEVLDSMVKILDRELGQTDVDKLVRYRDKLEERKEENRQFRIRF